MKQSIKGLIFGSLILIFFLACSQEPIFWAINKEIKLEKPNVQGQIYSIVKLKGSLYIANGGIYEKSLKTVRAWNAIGTPDKNRVIQLASDANSLYARTADAGKNQAVYVLTHGSWQKIAGLENADIIFDNGVIGDAATTTNRTAYVRIGGQVKQLDGTTAPATTINTNGAGANTQSAAYISSTTYFSDSKAFVAGNGKLYEGKGDTIHVGTDDTRNSSGTNVGGTLCYAYFENEKKLFVGTMAGIKEVSLDSSGNPTGVSGARANGQSNLNQYRIKTIASFGAIDNYAVYAGAMKPTNSRTNNLWAYYPSRGTWNYE